MLAKHRGLRITAEQRLRFVTLLSRAADDAGLPDDPEFRAAIMGYAEWGTRLAVHNSQPGRRRRAHAPVPRWGWGVAPPYQPSEARGAATSALDGCSPSTAASKGEK